MSYSRYQTIFQNVNPTENIVWLGKKFTRRYDVTVQHFLSDCLQSNWSCKNDTFILLHFTVLYNFWKIFILDIYKEIRNLYDFVRYFVYNSDRTFVFSQIVNIIIHEEVDHHPKPLMSQVQSKQLTWIRNTIRHALTRVRRKSQVS
jgi:hypothetical protein